MTAQSTQFQFVISKGNTSTNNGFPCLSYLTATSVSIPSAAYAPDGSTNFYSLQQPGDGYYGIADGLHTVTYTITPNFAGTLTMQASLATCPGPTDWFTVNNTSVTYLYPIIPASTTTNYVNFTGNFVWVRAYVARTADQPNGSVLFVNYNH